MKHLAVLLYIAILLPHIASGQTRELFTVVNNMDIDESSKLEKIKTRQGIKSTHLVMIENALSIKDMKSLYISIPGTGRIEYQRDDTFMGLSDRFTWRSSLKLVNTTVKLDVYSDDILVGIIQTPEYHYVIEPLGDGLHALIEVGNDSAIMSHERHDTHLVGGSGFSNPKRQNEMMEINSTPEIALMILYSDDARSDIGGTSLMEARILSAIGLLEDSFTNSEIDVTINLVHVAEVNFSEDSSMDTNLDRLYLTDDGHIDNIHILRDQYGADIVILLVESGDEVDSMSFGNSTASTGFSVAKYTKLITDYIIAHCLGHHIGSYHDHSSQANPNYNYGHGFSYELGEWQTIMSMKESGQRLNYWSNPDVTFASVAMGTPTYEDNARLWSERAPTIAGFKTPLGPPPSVYISGNTGMLEGSSEMFTANVSGGTSPYNYQWQVRHENDLYFTSVGSNSPYYTHTAGAPDGEYIRVYVTDANWPSVFDEEFIVIIGLGNKITTNVGTDHNPLAFNLSQNFPNPFNPSTIVSFSLPEPSQVNIQVYDVMGRSVSTIENGFKTAGQHHSTFIAPGLSSGVYIARLKAVGVSGAVFIQDVKMQLIK